MVRPNRLTRVALSVGVVENLPKSLRLFWNTICLKGGSVKLFARNLGGYLRYR